MEKIWLKQYPAGVPAEVKTDLYPSLVALMEESFRKYRDLPAYKFMGRSISFGDLARQPPVSVLHSHGVSVRFGPRSAPAPNASVTRISRN